MLTEKDLDEIQAWNSRGDYSGRPGELKRDLDLLVDAVRKLRASAEFWLSVRQHFFGDECWEMDYQEFVKLGTEAGLLEEVAYDPAKHGQLEDHEAGDPIPYQTDVAREVVRATGRP